MIVLCTQQFVLSDDGDGAEDEAELEFLKSLSTKEKKRLLKYVADSKRIGY
jgi:hypothetical protein